MQTRPSFISRRRDRSGGRVIILWITREEANWRLESSRSEEEEEEASMIEGERREERLKEE